MAPPAWAYQVDNFNPPPDEELVCSICQAVFCDPVQSPCNHVFCRNCITKWLESNRNCPICRKRTTRTTLQEVVPIVKNMIMKLVLHCHNSDRGCAETFPLESCESHVKECDYEMVQCQNKPCQQMFMKRHIQEHEQDCRYSFVRCKTCDLKILSWKTVPHDCVKELKKKLDGKVDKLKKCREEIKKLKEQVKNFRENDTFTTDSSSIESLSPTDILFSFGDNSNGSSSTFSPFSDSADEENNFLETNPSWLETNYSPALNSDLEQSQEGFHDQLQPQAREQTNEQESVVISEEQANESIEYPRSSSPINFDECRVFEVEGVDVGEEPVIRRPAKRRLATRITDSSDEETANIAVGNLPSRKRTWQGVTNAGSTFSELLAPSQSNHSTTESIEDSFTSSRTHPTIRRRLAPRSRSHPSSPGSSITVNTSFPQTSAPMFETTLSLLEQYNLESDPEWLPSAAADSLDEEDSCDIDFNPGHITSSDESSISTLDSDSSYEDATEARTEDLLNSFYDSSESDTEWQPK